MAEVTKRRTGEFLRKLFEILIAHPDGMQARDALAALEGQFELTEYEKGRYPSGGVRFLNVRRFQAAQAARFR